MYNSTNIRSGGKTMAEEFVLLQKVYDMMEYAYPAIAQFPKSEKYALGTDIKRCMDVK